MDLVPIDGLDYNGFPLNPRWGWDLTHNQPPDAQQLCENFNGPLGVPPCTRQFTWTNTPSGFNGLICQTGATTDLDGHLNWSPATYEGEIHWSDHSPPGWISGGDDDYNWDLWPANGGGLTVANPNTIQLEFDSDETVDNIGAGWWNQLHNAVDDSDYAARKLIGESECAPSPEAIVIGLMGLDAEHGGGSELHPVYGMAIHLRDPVMCGPQCTAREIHACRAECGGSSAEEGAQKFNQCMSACTGKCPAAPPPTNGPDETWAILARNWGDEGFCASDSKESVASNSLSFWIHRADASNVTVLQASFYSNATGRSVSVTPAPGGALVTFDLGAPQEENLISGSLQLRWTLTKSATGVQTSTTPGSGSGHGGTVNRLNPQVRAEAETRVNTFASHLSTAQRLEFHKLAMPARFQVANPVQLIQRSLPPKPTMSPKVISVLDERKKQRSLMRAHILCEAYGGKIPGLPENSCAGH